MGVLLYLYFRAFRALLAVLALVCLARSARAEPSESPEPRATAAAGPDRDVMLSFSISEYFLSPVRCLSAFGSRTTACAAASGRSMFLRESPRLVADPTTVAFQYVRRLSLARFVELGGIEIPRNDLPIDLGALALQIAGGLGMKWVLAGMVHARPTLTPTDGPHGVAFHPTFGTVPGGVTVGMMGAF